MTNKRTLTKKIEDVVYGGMQVRLLANLLDFIILGILFLPIWSIMDSLIYGDFSLKVVMQQVSFEMEELTKNDPNFDIVAYLKNNKLLEDFFVKNNGLSKIFLSMVMQYIILSIVFLGFWIKRQATYGKSILSLKIVDAETLSRPTNKQLIIRIISLAISVIPFFLGILWMAFDPKKQAWHDKIAGTLVIKEKRV